MSLNQCLQRLGVFPDHICGHSIGEWTGLITAGYFPESSIEPFISGLDPQGLSIPEVSFIAVGAGVEQVQEALTVKFGSNLEENGIYCSHDNCSHQSIYCVPLLLSQSVFWIQTKLSLWHKSCPFDLDFMPRTLNHLLKTSTKHLKTLDLQEPTYPLWSATTNQRYPNGDPTAFYKLNTEHLVQTVRFRTLIETLYEQGCLFKWSRVFSEFC